MKKKYKQRLDITVDQDVKEWIESESEANHLKPSQFVNKLLWDALKSESEKRKTK
jgi:hypothetical protein